jgi:hypothetical protein
LENNEKVAALGVTFKTLSKKLFKNKRKRTGKL